MSAAMRFVSGTVMLAGLLLASPAAHAQQDGIGGQKAQAAAAALQNGNLDQALALYGEALADRSLPNDRRSIILNDRGVTLTRLQQSRAAIEDFNRAAVLYPEYAPVYNNRGNLLLQLGQVREALKDFDRAVLLSPSYTAAFSNRGGAHLKLGQLDKAVNDYTRAIEISAQNASAYNGRGRAHLAANRPYSAQSDFTRAVLLNPAFAAAYRNRADAKAAIDQPDGAVEDLSRALAFEPRQLASYLKRGDAYLAGGNAASAVKDFNKAIEIAPESVIAYIGRGFAHAKVEAYDEALNDLARAIELNPREARAYAVRAWVYKQTQQPDLGQKDVERALRLEPVVADAYWAHGEIEEAFGRADTAAAAFTKALAADGNHREATAGLQRLGFKATRDASEVADAAFEKWHVYAVGGRFHAIHDSMPTLKVILEVFGAAPPKIVEWDRRKAPFAGIGVLRYAAGSIETPTGTEDIEKAAIIDTQAPAVISTQMTRKGGRNAKWTWDQGRLAVASADGTDEVLALRGAKSPVTTTTADPAEAAAKRAAEERAAQRERAANQQASARPPPPRQKPKSLFDLIFGN